MSVIGHTRMCQQATRRGTCCDRAKWKSPSGLLVCGTHRRWIDLDNQRRNTGLRCEAITDDPRSQP